MDRFSQLRRVATGLSPTGLADTFGVSHGFPDDVSVSSRGQEEVKHTEEEEAAIAELLGKVKAASTQQKKALRALSSHLEDGLGSPMASVCLYTALRRLVDDENEKEFQTLVSACSPFGVLDIPSTEKQHASDIAFSAYKKSSSPVHFAMFCRSLEAMNAHLALDELLQLMTYKEFSEDEVMDACSAIVTGALYPVCAALCVAAAFNEESNAEFTFSGAYRWLSPLFSATAAALLNDTESDIVASLLLFEVDPGCGQSPMALALDAHDLTFVGDPLVVRIMNTVWAIPEFMQTGKLSTGGLTTNEIVSRMLDKPKKFFMSCVGQYMAESLSFMLFTILFSAFVLQRIDVSSPLRALELLVYVFAGNFLVGEVTQVLEEGIQSYFQSGWNVVDVSIYSIFGVMVAVRASATEASGVLKQTLTTAFVICVALNCILLWTRTLYFFSIHPTVGPLLRMTERMMTDVKNFGIFLFLFLAGFTFSFRFLVGELEDYDSLSATVVTLFGTMLGQISFDAFDDVASHATRVVAIVLLGVYLCLSAIMLLNMLIAMMSETYESVQEKSKLEYIFNRNSLIHRYDQENNELPPPLNVFVWGVYIAWRAIELVLSALTFGHIPHVPVQASLLWDDDTTEWYCGFCHAQNSATSQADMSAQLRSYLIDAEQRVQEARLGNSGDDAPRRKRSRPRSRRGSSAEEASVLDEKYADGDSDAGGHRIVRPLHDPQDDALLGMDPDVVNDFDKINFAVVCTQCHRQRKSVDALGRRREVISFVVFMAFLWVPIFIVLALPLGVVRLIGMAVGSLEAPDNARQRRTSFSVSTSFAQEMVDSGAGSPRSTAASDSTASASAAGKSSVRTGFVRQSRARWVRSCYPEQDAALQDVQTQLTAMKERCERMLRQVESSRKSRA